MTVIRGLARGSLVLAMVVLILVAMPPADIKNAAKPRETSSGISIRLERQNLVDPTLQRALGISKTIEADSKTVEQGLPSDLPQFESFPQQPTPNLADGVDIKEEINFLIELYAAKYGVSISTLEQIIQCESRYNPEATGSAGERGLAQILFSTWLTTPEARFGWDAAYHPAVNIEAAAWMLSQGRANEWTCLR